MGDVELNLRQSKRVEQRRSLRLFLPSTPTMSSSLLVLAPARIVAGTYSSIISALTNLFILVWDGGLAIYNLVAPNRPENAVVPEGCPGARGVWPAYVPPGEGDCRCSCPMLNAMANHGA